MPDICGMCNATTAAAAAVEGQGQGSSSGRMMKCGKCKEQRYCSQYGYTHITHIPHKPHETRSHINHRAHIHTARSTATTHLARTPTPQGFNYGKHVHSAHTNARTLKSDCCTTHVHQPHRACQSRHWSTHKKHCFTPKETKARKRIARQTTVKDCTVCKKSALSVGHKLRKCEVF